MAKKGDWVRIHNIVLRAEDRTAKIPEDTQKCDLEMWVKGSLIEDEAQVGDIVTVETATGRKEKGVLLEENPHYTHSYGDFVPEIIEIDKRLRKIMSGGDK
ncbi:MAG: 2-amino-4-oxopentanoate thiolase subunit OrtA [Firmicutes bacterium]|nr:2-amino-4-oxopentanoate thiolase subunit OrtA [Bacillota bacterium]